MKQENHLNKQHLVFCDNLRQPKTTMDNLKEKTEFTAAEALACLNGVSKNAFYNAMKEGILSYDERAWGKRKKRYIQGVELVRVYGEKFNLNDKNSCFTGKTSRFTGQDGTTQNNTENKIILQELSLLQQKIAFLEDKIKDRDLHLTETKKREAQLQTRFDGVIDTLRQQTLCIEDMRASLSKTPANKRKGFFARLFG